MTPTEALENILNEARAGNIVIASIESNAGVDERFSDRDGALISRFNGKITYTIETHGND